MASEYPIKDLIDAALRRYNFDDSITKEHVERAYRKVVGEFIVKLTRSAYYDTRSKTLKVVLSAPALKNELSFKITDLCDAINKELGKEEVKKIMLL